MNDKTMRKTVLLWMGILQMANGHSAIRFAQLRDSQGKAIVDLLGEFANLRASNLRDLRRLRLTRSHLDLTGTHPAFGT
jgi:hypothetical protein